MQIQRSKISVLIVIFKLLEKYRRSYCWPTRLTIKKLLFKYHGIDISVWAIDKHLKSLNDNNFIISFRRYGRREDGTYFLKPSNRQLTKRGLSFLVSLGIKVSNWLTKFIFPKDKKPVRFSKKRFLGVEDPEHEKRRPRIPEFSDIGNLFKTVV